MWAALTCVSLSLCLSLPGCGGDGLSGAAAAATPARERLQRPPGHSSGTIFTLKVQINDAVTRHYLQEAHVDVFVNHTKTNSAFTEDSGGVVFRVPYELGLTLTVTASKGGYVLTSLPWKTRRVPVFAAVTLSMLPQSRASLWLFEDTVLITGGKMGGLNDKSHPSVQFPKGSLKLPEKITFSNLTAYLTAPQPPWGTDNFLTTLGTLMNKSGLKSIELTPLAAISVQLFSAEEDMTVTGPIHITLPLPPTHRVRHADALPAWTFDLKIGAWVNRGVGMVKNEGGRLIWIYEAPHLGHWIAAPLSINTGSIDRIAKDITAYHSVLLVAILGGTAVILVGFVAVLFCYCRGRYCKPRKKRRRKTKMEPSKKDQTTATTHVNLTPSIKDNLKSDENSGSQQAKILSYSPRRELTSKEVDDFCKRVGKTAEAKNKESCKIYVENVTVRSRRRLGETSHQREPTSQQVFSSAAELPKNALQIKHMKMLAKRKDITEEQYKTLHPTNEETYPLPNILNKHFPIYNPSVTILQTPDHFLTPGQVSRSATMPRNRQMIYSPLAEPVTRDSYTQTLPKMPMHSQQQAEAHREQQALQAQQEYINSKQELDSNPTIPANWGRYSNNLLESVSVPGTLNEAGGMTPFATELQGISEQTLLELTKGKPSPHPRAWFVSLEGKPVPQIRHSCVNAQKPKKTHSNDTSLDSGVDMNEHLIGKKLEKEKTFVKSTTPSKNLYSEEMDLSGSENGTAVCSPEDLTLRHVLDGKNGQLVEEALSQQEELGDRGSQPECRLGMIPQRKKGKRNSDQGEEDGKKSVWQKREERPLISLN
ncbi:protein FAM171B [Callorhinchus milii]|nr:protein FAM171B [Callorhinchus milii]